MLLEFGPGVAHEIGVVEVEAAVVLVVEANDSGDDDAVVEFPIPGCETCELGVTELRLRLEVVLVETEAAATVEKTMSELT